MERMERRRKTSAKKVNLDKVKFIRREIVQNIPIRKRNVDGYIDLMLNTRSIQLCNEIAYKLEKFKSESIKHALVRIISRKSRKGKAARLVVMCTKYDCSEYLRTFVNVLLNEETEAYLWAADVIGNMRGPFDRRTAMRNLAQITNAIGNNLSGEKLETLTRVRDHILRIMEA